MGKFDMLPDYNYFLNKPLPSHQEYIIEEYIDSGRLGHVFRAYNKSIRNSLACKFIPKDKISPSFLKDGKWKDEARKANALSNPSVVRCQFDDWWSDLDEGFECAVLCYDYVNGKSLKNYIKYNINDITIPFVETLLVALLRLLNELKVKGWVHGDLHAGNILVENQSEYMLEESFLFRVTDFAVGYSSMESILLDDFEQTAVIVRELLQKIDYQNATPREKYVFNVFNNELVGRYLIEKDESADPYGRKPDKMFERVKSLDSEFRQQSGTQVNSLTSPFDFLSLEQIGEAHRILKTLYSDRFLGLDFIQSKNNLVLTGPRGCGKSTVFKCVSLKHRLITDSVNRSPLDYVGVYYRCDDLYYAFPRYSSPKIDEAIDLPVHFLTSSLLEECLSNIYLWANKIFPEDLKKEEENACKEIWKALGLPVPNSPSAFYFTEIIARLNKERKRAADKYAFSNDPKQKWKKYFGVATLGKICDSIQSNLSFLNDIPIYFFIDDYSYPKITFELQKNLNRLLMQRSSSMFFKLSTESPVSFVDSDIDGKRFVENREYVLVNLGLTYLQETRERKLHFVEDVFSKRLNAVPGYPVNNLEEILGVSNVSKNSMARKIRSSGKTEVWGKDHLTDLCSGDIHYIINLVGRMVADIGAVDGLSKQTNVPRIPKNVQNNAIREEAGNFLTNLRNNYKHGDRLVKIVEAFGNVAKSYIVYKNSRNQKGNPPWQASRIEPLTSLELDGDALDIFRELLRYSVFIQDQRGKSIRGKIVPRIWLRRCLVPHFNLTFSKRDSLPFSNKQIRQLLLNPEGFEDKYRIRKIEPTNDKQSSLDFDLE